MATVRSQDAICRIVKDGILELETEADPEPDYYSVVVIEDKLLVIDYKACNLQLYNRHDGKLISKSHELESSPIDVCLISKMEVAMCLSDGTIVIMSLKSIDEIKLIKTLRTGFHPCHSLAKFNSDKIVVSGKKGGMLCWGVLSIRDGHLNSTHDICEGDWTHIAIKDNTLYISCWTRDSITNGVYAYDIFNPHTQKFLYQHQELKRPWSISTDRDCVYVCDLFSKRIHQLTDSGQLVTIHIVSSSLYGIFYDDQHGVLYTTSYGSNVITVYKMESLHQPGMSGGNRRNVDPRQSKRPKSAWIRSREDELSRQDDSMTTGSVEADLNTLINATAALQTVDFHRLRRRLNLQSTDDLKNGQDGQETNNSGAENVDWETKYMDLYDKFTKQIEEKQSLENELKNITAQLKTTTQTSLDQKKEQYRLQQRVESGDKRMKTLKQKIKECTNELKSKEKIIQAQLKEMKEVQKSKDVALTRSVPQIGHQMSEGNPSIPDLSEQNRPSKLGEMYSELYDDEWIDAFEVLTETFHLDDKSSINLLLKILWESSNYASDVSQSTMKTTENLLSGSSEGPTSDCRRLLREARKHVDINKADILLQDFRDKLTRLVEMNYLREEKVEVYIKKSFQLCWLMSIQDPPVVLSREPKRGAQFDTNLYKHYIHSGDNIDYVIWPALLLHTDGPLLAKGVAEPCTIPKAKSAPATAKDDKSFAKRSQIEHDGNVRESTSGSDRMDTAQYGNDAPFSSKSRNSPIVTQKYPVHESKYRVHSETPSTRDQSPVSKDDMSIDKRSQIAHDEKVRESTSGSGRMDTTQYGNDAPFLSKSRYSPIVTKKYPVHESKYRVNSETPSTRAHSPVSKDDVSVDKRSQIAHDEKVRESTSGSGRMDTTQYGHDAPFSSKSGYSSIATQKYPIHESKYNVPSSTPTTPGQSPVSEQMQLYQHDVFASRNDRDRFQRFCKDLLKFRESSLRLIYDKDYDRYYMIYLNRTHGHQNFT